MFVRLYLDPTPDAGSGAVAFAPPGPPAPTPLPPGPPAPPPPPATKVELPADEVARLYSVSREFARFQAEREESERKLREEATLAQARKGELEQAFNAMKADHEGRYTALQTAYLASETERTVAAALNGFSFRSPAAAEQAQAILRGALESRIESGRVVVTDRTTGRPAADVIRERLGSDDFAHFLAPKGHAGTIPPGQNPTAGH
jgi:hypothetical protein